MAGSILTGLITYLTVQIIIRHIIAKKFEQIAFTKGYGNEIHSYAMCLWLGTIGCLYVIALPNATLDNAMLKRQQKLINILEKQITEDYSFSDTNPNEEILDTEVFSCINEIKKYKQLLDQDIITQEEFAAVKKKLLGL